MIQPDQLYTTEVVYRDSTGTVHPTALDAARATTKERLSAFLSRNPAFLRSECEELADVLVKHHTPIMDILAAYEQEHQARNVT